jgi:hypothetical protein
MRPTGLGLVVSVVAGCSSSSSPPAVDGPGGTADVTGAAAKGPLLAGSPITVHMIDAAAHPTGVNYNTTTSDDLGRFNLTVSSTGDAELQADGFYFNEVTGGLSTSQITLFALAPIASGPGQQIYLNSYTHMSEARAKMLMAGGMSMSAAIDQAETELRTGLGLFVPGTLATGTSLDLLGGDTDANAYLFALSCTLANAAGGSDAMLQQLINNIALDLADNGMLNNPPPGRQFMDVDACVSNMQMRLMMQTGSAVTLPNIDRALDFDGDGISDFNDPDADGDGIPASADKIVGGSASSRGCNFAVDSSGQVWAWSIPSGTNECMALGDGTNFPHHNARPIPGLSAAQVAQDGPKAYAVKTDGTLVSWTSFAAPAAVPGVTSLRLTPSAIAIYVGLPFAVQTDGTLIQIGDNSGGTAVTPVSGVSGVQAVVAGPMQTSSPSLLLQNTDGSVAVLTVNGGGANTVVTVTGVSGVTTAGAISASPNFGFAISNGDVYSFPWSGGTIAATKVNGLPANGIVSLSAGYAVDQSGQVWDIHVPSAPTQFMSGVSQIASPGMPLLFLKSDGSLWMTGHSQAFQVHIPH